MYRRPLSPELLQGDVVDHISYPVARGLPQTDEVATIVLKKNRIVLVSHSCDLVDARNKRPAFLFAPLIPVVNYIKKDADRYEAFKRNILDPEKPTFINLFRYAAASHCSENSQMSSGSLWR